MRKILLGRIAAAFYLSLLSAHAGSEKSDINHSIPRSEIGARSTAGYKGDALSIMQTAQGARLHCSFQRMEGEATRDGLWITSISGSGDRFRVTATRVGGDAGGTALPTVGDVRVIGSIVRWARAGLDEEYSVSVDGLRQDFVVAKSPGGSGDLRVELEVDGATAAAVAYGARLALNGSGREIAYSRLRAVDNLGKELPARLQAISETRLAIVVKDGGASYPIRIDPTFSDANWVSLGGALGTTGPVNAMAVNTNTGVVYVGGSFIAAGETPASDIVAWDGTNWISLGLGVHSAIASSAKVNALALDDAGNLYVAGSFTNAGVVQANNIAMWNGSSWSALGSGVSGTVSALALDQSGNVYAGGSFTAAGGSPANRIAEWNGSSWSALGSGMNNPVNTLTVDGSGNVYAGGVFTSAGGVVVNRVAQWNGTAWSALGSGMNSTVDVLRFDEAGNLYAGGFFTTAGGVTASSIAKWDGTSWSGLNSDTVGGNIASLAFDGLGNMYAGGDFVGFAGLNTSGIVKWDGSNWSALGPGLGQSGSSVNALAFDGSGNLLTGGSYNRSYFANQDYISKWDGTTWSVLKPVPVGLSSTVLAVAVDNAGNLYAGGLSIPAKWNGTNWSSLATYWAGGPGRTPEVGAFALDGSGNLYVGGGFASINGVTAANVAKWDGNTWSALGAGLGFVNALAADNSGHVYAGTTGVQMWDGNTWTNTGGNNGVYALTFDASGNLYAGGYNYIAKWNGAAWSPLGTGDVGGGVVYALAVDKLGNVYIGGTFGIVSGVSALNVAVWNGNAWSALGPGIRGPDAGVFGLAVDTFGNLYEGGHDSGVPGYPSIEEWNGATWLTLGSGVNGNVLALTADQSGHLYAGGNFTFAGTNYSPYVAQANLTQALGVITANNSNGVLTLTLPGQPGSSCVIQASTNLANWSSISTNVCGTSGLWTITNAASGSQMFFRAILP